MFRKLLTALAVAAVALGGASIWIDRQLHAPLRLPAGGEVLVVARGETLTGVAARLHEQGYLPQIGRAHV